MHIKIIFVCSIRLGGCCKDIYRLLSFIQKVEWMIKVLNACARPLWVYVVAGLTRDEAISHVKRGLMGYDCRYWQTTELYSYNYWRI